MAASKSPDHNRTVVLDDEYHRNVEDTADAQLEETNYSRTRVVSDELEVDGDRFGWWAVGNGPVLVTVSHPILGRKAEFTTGDPKRFAESLARSLAEGV